MWQGGSFLVYQKKLKCKKSVTVRAKGTELDFFSTSEQLCDERFAEMVATKSHYLVIDAKKFLAALPLILLLLPNLKKTRLTDALDLYYLN